ncbi:NAD(P)-dependent alcohol dehydrogenase [Hyphobacterium sp. HN65]|uniref:NAD(P)-dependent alcohol dehydrogenase n=1 Tax=Hyphobacterium lacteum TaxID=3116575 RepID=A0ABU7LNC7_9PROT|nr:NAD(P)-dependent alcohol dehydrogenase [Hyphobacterium sp. HN65]MEE2525425.1 NAD(P)-dependent alcohol dehydrogenase [Hyphobacterium sp. HN65]
MIRAWAAKEQGGALERYDYDPGPLPADEVEIAVETCGLCHSDVSLIDNEWFVSQYPLVPGHEVIGRVSEVGAHVTHLKIGDRVGVGWYAHSCLTCHTCMSGDHNMCSDAKGVAAAHQGRFGGFADKVRSQAAWAVKLPEGVDAAKAGPLFCGGITVFNPIVQNNIKPTDKVGVIGIGGLGHMAVKFLRAWGCEVTAFTSTEAKAEEARAMGAHRIVNSRDEAALKAERGRYDMVLSTVNVPLKWSRYIAALAPRGKLHMVGAVMDPMPVAAGMLMDNQRSVTGSSVGAPATIATMLDFCARHDITPQTEHLPMSKINEAIARLKKGDVRYRFVLEADFD